MAVKGTIGPFSGDNLGSHLLSSAGFAWLPRMTFKQRCKSCLCYGNCIIRYSLFMLFKSTVNNHPVFRIPNDDKLGNLMPDTAGFSKRMHHCQLPIWCYQKLDFEYIIVFPCCWWPCRCDASTVRRSLSLEVKLLLQKFIACKLLSLDTINKRIAEFHMITNSASLGQKVIILIWTVSLLKDKISAICQSSPVY